jgi:hypothetical protein
MLNAIGDSLSDLASSEDEEDGADEGGDETDPELGKLSEDDEPGWVIGTISRTVQLRMQSIWQKHMKLNELTQPRWEDPANYFRKTDMNYGMTEVKVPADVKPHTDTAAATPSPTTFGELMQVLDIILGQSKMQQVTSRQGSSKTRLGSEKPQADNDVVSLIRDAVANS